MYANITGTKKSRYIVIVLLLILAAGFFFRFFQISKENLWYDESYTILSIKQAGLTDVIKSVDKYEVHSPPFYFILLHIWSNIFGYSELYLRFFSLIFGFASIIMIYLLARELFGKKAGILSALLLAISPLQISFSQEARAYTLFIFLTLCSFYFFLRMIEDFKIFYIILYLIATALSFYTLVLAIISIALQNLIYFYIFYLSDNKKIKKWIIVQLMLIVSLLPGLKTALLSIYGNLNQGIFIFLYKYGLPKWINYIIISFFILLGLATIFALFWQYKNKSKIVKKNLNLLMLNKKVFVALIILFLVGEVVFVPSLWGAFFLVRFTIFLYFIFYIFLSVNILKFKKVGSTIIILLLILTSSLIMIRYYQEDRKTSWEKIASYVQSNSKSNEIILFGGGKYAFGYYYKGNLSLIEFFPVDDYKVSKEEVEKNIRVILSNNKGINSIWFVTFRQWLSEPYVDYLKEKYELKIDKAFKDTKVYYFIIDEQHKDN